MFNQNFRLNKKNEIAALLLFGIFIALQLYSERQQNKIQLLRSPPAEQSLIEFNFGEPKLVSRALMLWLQTFDSQSGLIIQFDDIDYNILIQWLDIVRSLHPNSQYALLVATHLFTQSRREDNIRLMLAYINNSFMQNPALYWRWQAYAVVLAKHRLEDINLALQYAQQLNNLTKNEQIDYWARDLEFLLLEDIGEFEASAVLIKNLLDNGEITDARELQFLTNKLKQLRTQ